MLKKRKMKRGTFPDVIGKRSAETARRLRVMKTSHGAMQPLSRSRRALGVPAPFPLRDRSQERCARSKKSGSIAASSAGARWALAGACAGGDASACGGAASTGGAPAGAGGEAVSTSAAGGQGVERWPTHVGADGSSRRVVGGAPGRSRCALSGRDGERWPTHVEAPAGRAVAASSAEDLRRDEDGVAGRALSEGRGERLIAACSSAAERARRSAMCPSASRSARSAGGHLDFCAGTGGSAPPGSGSKRRMERALGRGGGDSTCAAASATGVGRSKGSRPVAISKSSTPHA